MTPQQLADVLNALGVKPESGAPMLIGGGDKAMVVWTVVGLEWRPA